MAENLLIGVEKKALHNEDVSFLLLTVVRLWDDLSIQGVINAMRLLKLHWVLQPCVDCTHHGIHVQSSNDYRKMQVGEKRSIEGGKKNLQRKSKHCMSSSSLCLLHANYK